jgi:catechol 2,3-dioxygenase-like lactoylglutathione lyase family enzyme
MIKSLSHTSIFVDNQDEALAFYTTKLGFEVRTDVKMDSFRWLTVGPKEQKDIQIVLMEPKPSFMYDEESVAMLRKLLKKGSLGAGVFETSDCRATYTELKKRGVEFRSEPTEKPWGTEAIFKDNSGNWFSLTQRK